MKQTQILEPTEIYSAGGDLIEEPLSEEPSSEEEQDWIVPPGLKYYIRLFEAHYIAAKEKPIIVAGPTGVGKKLFLRIFKKLYTEENSTGPIVTVNCSHLDENLARSELFGYIKGAFTGAYKDKQGFVETANKGALILEEIGELPKPVQAKLLTFIESKRFYRVGDTKKERFSKVKIIGSTNNVENLRQDFRARFSEFHIPPLYERREDVLYYLYAKFPEIVQDLASWDVLALLSYNYPDNVRGVENVGTLVTRRKIFLNPRTKRLIELIGPSADLKLEDTPIPIRSIIWVYGKLFGERRLNIRPGDFIRSIDSFLNKYRIGIDYRHPKPAFPDWKKYEMELLPDDEKYGKRFGVKIRSFKPFEQAYVGYLLFCSLFFQNPQFEGNVTDMKKCTSQYPQWWRAYLSKVSHISPSFERSFMKLKKQILQHLTGIKLPKEIEVELIKDADSAEIPLYNLLKKHRANPFLSSDEEGLQTQVPQEEVKGNVVKIDLTKKYDDVLRDYHQKLIEYVGGNKKKAAELVSVNYQTFIGRIKRLGLK